MSSTPNDDDKKPHYPNAWESLKLGQIKRLVRHREYGEWSKNVEDISASTLAREIERIEEAFGIGKLLAKEKILTPLGELMASNFQPFIEFCARLGSGEILGTEEARRFRIGTGGSLASWLIGSRLENIRRAITTAQESSATGRRAQRIEVEVLRNRVTVQNVMSGALDCGLVREGVLDDRRLKLRQKHIGTIEYYLYVPNDKINSLQPDMLEKVRRTRTNGILDDDVERFLLERGPCGTVGPDGEFRVELDARLRDQGVRANIELQHRAFPMLLPNMLHGTHVFIMPDIRAIGGIEPPGFEKFRLGLLVKYLRKIFLVAHEQHLTRMPWLDFDRLAHELRF